MKYPIAEDGTILTKAINDMTKSPWQSFNAPRFSSPTEAYMAQRLFWLTQLLKHEPWASDIFAENYPARSESNLTPHGQVISIKGWPYDSVVNTQPAKPGKLVTKRAEILETASKLIHGDREADYGRPIDSFTRVAAAFNIVLEGIGHEPITPTDAAKLMIALKFSRLSGGDNKDDTWIDLAGYAALGAEVHNS